MELTISYQDGSRRILNVIPEFKSDIEVRLKHKTTVVTYEQKCLDIALSGGANPYEIVLREGTDVVHTRTLVANKPIEKQKEQWHAFVTKGTPTKKEMKEASRRTFTKKWVPSREYMPWERGIKLLLNHIVD